MPLPKSVFTSFSVSDWECHPWGCRLPYSRQSRFECISSQRLLVTTEGDGQNVKQDMEISSKRVVVGIWVEI
ncbi:hypothetical protein ACEYW6_24490, partial [Nostoc sp. UIC 10607]|uniref:hypothetical protein n=1 Tax=Nostoc sp. UIC 10607 TaxID=3045935 RepID=UPI0039A17289